jgi:hypothetical protein
MVAPAALESVELSALLGVLIAFVLVLVSGFACAVAA